MPIEVQNAERGSPEWWFKRLGDKLVKRRADLDMLERYYRGDPPLPTGAKAAQDAFYLFQKKARANYAKIIVESVRQKMVVVGFRSGADGNETLDLEAQRIFEANQLGANQTLVHRASLVMRDGYAIVGVNEADETTPFITPEDPRQVITEHDPIQRRKVIAGLKVYTDEADGVEVAYLYLHRGDDVGGIIHRATRSLKKNGSITSNSWNPKDWEWDFDASVEYPLPGETGIFRCANDPDIYGDSVGEFEDFIDTLNRINHMILQRMMIATLQAFRQRAIEGLPLVDAEGNEVDYEGLFSADPGALWQIPEGAKMWESGQVDLSPILLAVEADVKELAAISQTPTYMMTDATNQSAEGAALQKEGRNAKVRDRTTSAGEFWEAVMSCALRLAGNDVDIVDMETIWEKPDAPSLSERASAATQAKAAGVPWETVMSDIMGYTPQQIRRMKTQRDDDQVIALIVAAQTAAATAPPETASTPAADEG